MITTYYNYVIGLNMATFGRGSKYVEEDFAPMGRGQILQKMFAMKIQIQKRQKEAESLEKSKQNDILNVNDLTSGYITPNSLIDMNNLDQTETCTLDPVVELKSQPSQQRDCNANTIATKPDKDIVIRQKVGKAGTSLPMLVNYIKLKSSLTGVLKYHVNFDPLMDSIYKATAMLYQHSDLFGKGRAFDGSVLFTANRLKDDVMFLKSTTREGKHVDITVKFIKIIPISEMVTFFNILFNKIMKILKFERIGMNFYDPRSLMTIPQHKLEVWPGYITHVCDNDGGLMLQCDTSHRVVSQQTVYSSMHDIYSKYPNKFIDEFSKKIIGLVVVTRYNNKNYRIDDFLSSISPMTTFNRMGENITYKDYYKEMYNITINDLKQPMLICKSKSKGLKGSSLREQTDKQIVCLVPELCYITGLTDELRSDFRVMKDLALHTRLSPQQRSHSLKQFCININQNSDCIEELKRWKLELSTDLTTVDARVLPHEAIFFGGNYKYLCDNTASWNRDACRKRVISAVHLSKWLLIFTNKDSSRGLDFKKTLFEVIGSMGIQISQPIVEVLQNDKIESYLSAIRKHYNKQLQFVIVIFPSSRDDRYNAIKTFCSSENTPLLSQVIISSTLKQQKIRSCTQKIALQINCKLGGSLWTVNIPSKVIMVCGVDVYHDPSRKNPSVVGFVSSLNPTCSRWYSSAKMQHPGEEIIASMNHCFRRAIQKYHEVNGALPERIFIYRDGVGNGQLDTVSNYEIEQLLNVFKEINSNYNPKFTIIICQKRINAKIMNNANDQLSNPEPGTIIDTVITRPNFVDFFLVSQHVTQGTVTPSHYIVIHNSSEWGIDHIQKLTYKFTHMYYNWPGTIRTPAPCQYAHKIAYQVGQNTKILPNEVLCDKLYYL